MIDSKIFALICRARVCWAYMKIRPFGNINSEQISLKKPIVIVFRSPSCELGSLAYLCSPNFRRLIPEWNFVG